jgi:integrase
MSVWVLWEAYIAGKKPAAGTVARWRTVFNHLRTTFPDINADEVTEADARRWANTLVTAKRSEQTVANIWVAAARTVFSWGRKQKLVKQNPFADVRPDVPRKARNRETKAFTPQEAQVILVGASAVTGTTPFARAQRWVMWLCAYSGARAGEITQMRGVDVEKRGKIHVMKITPEAGPTKTRNAHAVPLHEHIIAQGFLEFVEMQGKGPLFYSPRKNAPPNDPTKPVLSPAVRMRGKLGTWVRSLGITDLEVGPTHGWRHSFKQIAHRVGITDRVSDAITDHKPPSIGRSYGAPTVEDMAAALKKFPRYQLDDTAARKGESSRKGAAKKRKR